MGYNRGLHRKAEKYVHLQTNEEKKDSKQQFYEIDNFPNGVDLIDGTHVRIIAQSEYEDAYVNHKGYHSINTQILAHGAGLLRNIDDKEGSRHCSRILQDSFV